LWAKATGPFFFRWLEVLKEDVAERCLSGAACGDIKVWDVKTGA
jgi:hypothetical protein